MKVVLASNNHGKVREFNQLLSDMSWQIVSQKELGITSAREVGMTFAENALIKARHCNQVSGLPTLADDSGLEVDYLGGAPGIYSARFAGENATNKNNMDKLLQALTDIPMENRKARFVCVLALVRDRKDEHPILSKGVWQGYISQSPMGENGFGYDPVFYVPTHDCTAAQMSPESKNQLSHRTRALQDLRTKIQDMIF